MIKMLKQKKLAIIFSSYDDIKNPYYAGGGALAIHEVAKRLAKNFSVRVLTGNYPSARRKEIIDGVHYERLGLASLGPRLNQIIFHVLLIWRIRYESFDVWIESFTPPFSTSFLPLFTSRPVIGLVHMLSGCDMRRKYFLPFDYIERVGLKVYSYCIVTSKLFGEKIVEINRKAQITVIPNGVDVDVLQSLKKTEEYILFLGRIEVNQKGLDLLLEAYNLARKSINIPLVIAGTGTENEMRKLEQLIKKMKLRESVKLLGRIMGDVAKKQLFQKAFCCIIPSRFETFSLVALEAMASGTPLVTFDLDGFRWLSDENVVKVVSLDTYTLAQKIIELCNDAEMRKKLSHNGSALVKQYDWDSISMQYESVISNVLKK
jgi:glycosyltransferase involved in cell wall biosynthesis